MGFKIGDKVIITPPKGSMFYEYYNGVVGKITTVLNINEEFLVEVNNTTQYWPARYLSPVEDEEDIEPLDILNIM